MFTLLKKIAGKTDVLKEPEIPGFMPLNVCQRIFDEVVSLDAKEVLEIGTFMGRSAWAITSALRFLGGRRKLTCVDFFGSPVLPPEDHPEMKQLKEKYPAAFEHYFTRKKIRSDKEGYDYTLKRFPFMKKRIELKVCDSRTLDFGREIFDFVFIDGSHVYEMIQNDFERTFPALKRGGTVCFDDYRPHFQGVVRFVDELRAHPGLILQEPFGKLQFFRKL